MPDLDKIQGNILHPFKIRRGVYLFLRFVDRVGARRKLTERLKEYITSAKEQKTHHQSQSQTRQKPVHGAFGLSWQGYQFLGLSKYLPSDDPRDLKWFKAGLAEPPETFYELDWDPKHDSESWEAAYLDNPIHAVVILTSESGARLASRVFQLKKELRNVAQIVAHEDTFRRIWKYHDIQAPKEHFGFRDGIMTHPDPAQVLVDESPLQPAGPTTQGSYLAILKLEQNPYKFRKDAEVLAERIRGSCGQEPVDWKAAQAMAVGRWQDGQPLVSAPATHGEPARSGDLGLKGFDFANDTAGERCPVQAHIRKMNRRGPAQGAASEIVRRGMFYGPERQDFTRQFDQLPPSGGVGLMFTSYQANLLSFVTLLNIANDPENLDAVIGRSRGPGSAAHQRWPSGGCDVEHLMADFVTPRGGGYFFAPSMELIRNVDSLEG